MNNWKNKIVWIHTLKWGELASQVEKKWLKMAVITNFLVLLVYGVMLGAGAGNNQVIEESQCSLDRNDEALHCFLR